MRPVTSSLLAGVELKIAGSKYLEGLQASTQSGALFGVFDKWFIRVVTRLSSLDPEKPWEESVATETARAPSGSASLEWDLLRLRLFLDRRQQGRFVSYAQREASAQHYFPRFGTEFGSDVLLTCQGAGAAAQWRGLPLMKTAFDLALYPQLLSNVRPKTIFEIGSGTGGSAMWLADHMALLGIAGSVHSVDLLPVKSQHSGVTFTAGDCRQPHTLFAEEVLAAAPHPWLVIEDAHQNVGGVLVHLHPYLIEGDYIFVEDSDIKRDDLRGFLSSREAAYRVDTHYTDFFGRNATCALDSIFIRTAAP
ncbi:MAG: cephalosporin hydroxylase [Pseudomonadota bacterium]|nr:cephalosporin hydroxylase [Pseudomonadota bacterium]